MHCASPPKIQTHSACRVAMSMQRQRTRGPTPLHQGKMLDVLQSRFPGVLSTICTAHHPLRLFSLSNTQQKGSAQKIQLKPICSAVNGSWRIKGWVGLLKERRADQSPPNLLLVHENDHVGTRLRFSGIRKKLRVQ